MVTVELRYVGRFSDTEIDGIGLVKRGGTIPVPKNIADELLKREPIQWELAKKNETKGRGKKGSGDKCQRQDSDAAAGGR